MATCFERMTAEALNLWYEQNVGYRPQEDDPTMTDEELCELCKEVDAIHRDPSLANRVIVKR